MSNFLTVAEPQSWLYKRQGAPQQLRQQGLFTDVELKVSDRVFHAHKVIMASHGEFFLKLFQSPMKESEEGSVTFHDIDPDVFEHILDYIYTGSVCSNLSFEVTKSLLLAANMWQLQDLETFLLQRLVDICSPSSCIKIFLFLNSTCDLFFNQTPSIKQNIEAILVETVRDRWHIIASPANHLDSESDDYVATLVDLDIDSLKIVLSVKSDQEEIGDFSFSFNQTDLCLAVIQWIKYDLPNRGRNLKELSEFFCLHQISVTCSRVLSELCEEIKGICDYDVSVDLKHCRGFWCPARPIPGLVIAHAWSPAINNRITCDHIFFYFTIPRDMSTFKSQPLHTNFFYDLGQFGDLGEGEKHLLIPNNCLAHANGHMLLTYEDGRLCGTIVDPVEDRQRCLAHNSDMYRFCQSVVNECVCEFNKLSICSDELHEQILVLTCPTCQNDEASYNPHCDTFCMISSDKFGRLSDLSDKATVYHQDFIHVLGGYHLEVGKTFSYVYCSFELQEFGQMVNNATNAEFESYKSGHSHIKTCIGYLRDTPMPNLITYKVHAKSASKNFTKENDMILQEPRGNSGTAIFNGELWMVGGNDIAYDNENVLFYQRPLSSTCIYSWESKRWRCGPELPSQSSDESRVMFPGVVNGSCFVFKGKLYFSGGARLKINTEHESNQIYEFVPNTAVFCLNEAQSSWDVILDLAHFASKFQDDLKYTILGIFPAEISLPKLKVTKNQAVPKFVIKYLNINFKSGSEKDKMVY